MVRTQIQLTDAQVEELKELASSRHLSVAELIRQAVDAILRTNASVGREERRSRALGVAGRFGSGASDISSKHDAHLVETFGK
jgi:Arc/MetJ-type ribon-helix-helix transcriptional regulator